jgi:hypothetical protein
MTDKERLHQLLDLFDSRALSDVENAELKQLLTQPELRRTLVNRARLEATIIERTQHWAAEERAAEAFTPTQPSMWQSFWETLTETFTPRAWAWSAAGTIALLASTFTLLAQRPVARLANVSGIVHVQRGEVSLPGVNGLGLRQGDVILTDATSAATVRWQQEQTLIRVHSSAELYLDSIDGGKKLVLRSGLVTATVAKQPPGNPLLLTTPNARAEVLGTRFKLNAKPEQTKLDVNSGRVQLSRGDDGTGIIVERLQSAIVPVTGEVRVKHQSPDSTLRDGLLARWTMTRGHDKLTLFDTSESKHQLHLKNGANIAADRGGSVMVFTKKDATATCSDLTLPGDFTISFWLKMQPLEQHLGLQPLIANSPAGIARDGFRFSITKAKVPDQRQLYFETGNGRVGVHARSHILPPISMQWHHITVTVSRDTGRCGIHLDGENITEVSGIRSDFALDRTILVGQMPTSYRHTLNGAMDDLRIYGRLLTGTEISALVKEEE